MQDKDNGNLIIYVELECPHCGKKDFNSYPPPGITLADFNVNEIPKLICPCGNTYKSKPIFGVSPDWKGLQNGNDDQQRIEVKNEQQKELIESRPPVLEEDIQFLVSLGDSEMCYVARGEVAEMYSIPVDDVDHLILGIIYGDNL